MKIGTKVILTDGSYSMQIEDGQIKSTGDVVMGYGPNYIKYELVETGLKLPYRNHFGGVQWNDTIIKNVETGKLIFTQMRFIKEAKPDPIAVDVMTAVKALSEHKNVHCVKGNSTYHYKTVGAFIDQNGDPAWIEQILEGVWYIDD